jgi:hypothetical protein
MRSVLIALFVLAAAAVVWVLPVRGHDTIGHFQNNYGSEYLYGKRIGGDTIVNCCLHLDSNGRRGDCQPMPVSRVEEVDGGYLLDGEFIKTEDTNISPDQHWYRCRYAGQPSHCAFRPVVWN